MFGSIFRMVQAWVHLDVMIITCFYESSAFVASVKDLLIF